MNTCVLSSGKAWNYRAWQRILEALTPISISPLHLEEIGRYKAEVAEVADMIAGLDGENE
jgi:hypothetical protein